MQIPAKIKL